MNNSYILTSLCKWIKSWSICFPDMFYDGCNTALSGEEGCKGEQQGGADSGKGLHRPFQEMAGKAPSSNQTAARTFKCSCLIMQLGFALITEWSAEAAEQPGQIKINPSSLELECVYLASHTSYQTRGAEEGKAVVFRGRLSVLGIADSKSKLKKKIMHEPHLLPAGHRNGGGGLLVGIISLGCTDPLLGKEPNTPTTWTAELKTHWSTPPPPTPPVF